MSASSDAHPDPASPAGAGAGDAHHPATVATFAPTPGGVSAAAALHRTLARTVLVQQRSPLLVATPPPVTRALAFAHPFVLPLADLLGAATWSAASPWPSALLLAAFWLALLYGDRAVVAAGPLLLVAALTAGLYGRRFSPLSTTRAAREAGSAAAGQPQAQQQQSHKREGSDAAGAAGNSAGGSSSGGSGGGNGSRGSAGMRPQQSLDEIVATLELFTARCHLALDPFLRLTDLLSSQRSPTEASTRPALTALLVRVLFVLPGWIVLAHPAVGVVTTRRVALLLGTLLLTWHARPARVLRALLWRSRTVRALLAALTGLELRGDTAPGAPSPGGGAAAAAAKRAARPGPGGGRVRFTFAVYQNQRRWLGLGWTASLLAYERAAWTDEHLNASPPKESFKLPDGGGEGAGGAAWRWVEGSEWRVEPPPGTKDGDGGGGGGKGKSEGWVFYDNKWNHGSAADGWGKYTRRRKWVRDAELVDVDAPPPKKTAGTDEPASTTGAAATGSSDANAGPTAAAPSTPARAKGADAETASIAPSAKRRGLFSRRNTATTPAATPAATTTSASSSAKTNLSQRSQRDERDEDETPLRSEADGNYAYGDEMKMNLG